MLDIAPIEIPEENRRQLKELTTRHQDILRFAALNWTADEIAVEVGVTSRTVSTTLNSELGKARTAFLQGHEDEIVMSTLAELKELLPECVKVTRAILKGERDENCQISPALRFRAVTEVMDRVGLPKETKSRSTHVGYFGRIDQGGLVDRATELGYIERPEAINVNALPEAQGA